MTKNQAAVATSTAHDVDEPIKFAYWVPNVSGGLVISSIDQRTDWSLDYNIKLAQIAEQSGFDYALVQIRFIGSYGADSQHESASFATGLLLNTEKLNVITAILPGPWHPAVVAKLGATVDQLSKGRWKVNIVSGWFKDEFTALGEPWLEHDERYRRSEEFIRVLKGIWTGDDFSFRGDFYRINHFTLKPKPIQQPHPEIFQGGASRAAKDMAGRVSDWYFTNGGTPEFIRAQIDDVNEVSRREAGGRRVKFGVNGFAIVRDTEEEARGIHADILRHAIPEAVKGFGDAVRQAGQSTGDRVGLWAASSPEDLVQYNDGFKTGLIGTPEQVAERIIALKDVGVDLVLLGFLHFQEEVKAFGERVIPIVRRLEAERAARRKAG